jgi:nicotinic acid phosphoribosyltransferase
MKAIPGLAKIVITFLGERDSIERIEAVFTELKLITGLKKAELYEKALEWIANNEIAKAKFIEYLENEKAKNQMMEIIE